LVATTNESKFPNDWSRDGRFLLYTQEDARTDPDLWISPLTASGTLSGPPAPFANTEFSESAGQFSPDTYWIAYASDESGRSEIYVQPFPTPPEGGSKVSISRDGGSQPRWRRDGKELFYLSFDGKLMAVDVTQGRVLKVGTPKPLFQAPATSIQNRTAMNGWAWDVTSDGKQFLFDAVKTSSESLTVVLNWSAEMEKK
jgi:Tol biopolymer transport system component